MIDIKKCGKFNKKQLAVGTMVEMEHTNNLYIAQRIAKQHLCENKKYYILLKKLGL
jgi:hypothetical protein